MDFASSLHLMARYFFNFFSFPLTPPSHPDSGLVFLLRLCSTSHLPNLHQSTSNPHADHLLLILCSTNPSSQCNSHHCKPVHYWVSPQHTWFICACIGALWTKAHHCCLLCSATSEHHLKAKSGKLWQPIVPPYTLTIRLSKLILWQFIAIKTAINNRRELNIFFSVLNIWLVSQPPTTLLHSCMLKRIGLKKCQT